MLRMTQQRLTTWTPLSIRSARAHLKLSQIAFAKELGTTQQRVSEWERGLTPKNAWQQLLTVYFHGKGVALSG